MTRDPSVQAVSSGQAGLPPRESNTDVILGIAVAMMVLSITNQQR